MRSQWQESSSPVVSRDVQLTPVSQKPSQTLVRKSVLKLNIQTNGIK
jgi:hypothetical protein